MVAYLVLAFGIYLAGGTWPRYGTPSPEGLQAIFFLPLYILSLPFIFIGAYSSPIVVVMGLWNFAEEAVCGERWGVLIWPAIAALSGSVVLWWWWADPMRMVEWIAD
jgi:hypothetical protein